MIMKVGSIVNFALMYLLAPTGAASGAAATGFVAKLFSEQTLKAWGAPGKRQSSLLDNFIQFHRMDKHLLDIFIADLGDLLPSMHLLL